MNIKKYLLLILIAGSWALFGCMDDNLLPTSDIDLYGSRGVFIVNEGNYLYGNSSINYYDIESGEEISNLFSLVNSIPLGDVASSITVHDDRAYIVVNNSGCIHVVDVNSFSLLGTIEGLPSPRYMLFIDNNLALVSDLYARAISIINPITFKVTGSIKTGDSTLPFYQHSSEQMVRVGSKVFTNSWSYDNQVLVINTDELKVVDSIEVGIQPLAMAKDSRNNLWIINDGGFAGNPYGFEIPSLMRINTSTQEVELRLNFSSLTDNAGQIATNAAGDSLYFICKHLYAIHIDDTTLPIEPLITRDGRNLRALAIDPLTGDIFISDAGDFMSEGMVYRYKSNGTPVDTFAVGITPGNFCFN